MACDAGSRHDSWLLEEPPHNPDEFVMVQPAEDPDWQAKSRVASAYADTAVYLSWAATLAERHPALVPLLENIQLSADDVNAWSLEIVSGAEPSDVAAKWVKGNSDLIASWMAQ